MDIEWLIYHLIHNDDDQFTSIVDLDIDLCRSDLDQWERLLVGFSRNRTVTSIELSRGYQRPVVTEDDLQNLFSELRKLPKLSKVKLDSFTTFDLEQTESLFVDNDIMEEIWVENSQCYSEDDDDEENMDESDNENDDDDHIRYQVFIGYLASMSTNRLRRLRIEVPEKLSHGANITTLLNASSKLESIVIETTNGISSVSTDTPNATDRRRNFATAMAALQSNAILKTLDMDFRITFSDFKHVATMLKHNNTLKHLCLRLETTTTRTTRDANHGTERGTDHDPYFMESIELFFDALKSNTNSALKSFSQYNLNDPKLYLAITDNRDEPLISASTGRTYTKRAQRLVDLGLDMLHFNLSLESFSFFLLDANTPYTVAKKELFLRLNQRGRRSVRHRDISESVPKSAWVDQLSKHSMDDLDGLYYYISTNPSICRMTYADTTRPSARERSTIVAVDESSKESKKEQRTGKGCHPTNTRDSFSPSPNILGSKTKRQRVDGIAFK